jgi:Ca2+/Na+ antiporter
MPSSQVRPITIALKMIIHEFSSAELLIDVVDVVLDGSGIDEKFLGITLFALVPNTTEFMNAISFALHGNIALRWVASVCASGRLRSLTGSLSAWKSVRHMPYRFACFRFRLWWLSLPGMLQKRWDPLLRLSGMFLIRFHS